MIYIYLLRDPITHRPRYIGLTRFPSKRLAQHKCARSTNLRLNRWINNLKKVNLTPLMQIIYEADIPELADSMERYFIRVYGADFGDLMNLTGGGEMAFGISDETRIKLSEAARARKGAYKMTQAHKDAISRAEKGRINKNAHYLVAWNKSLRGVPLKEETKKKLSEKLQGRKIPPHTIEAIRNAAIERWKDPIYRERTIKTARVPLDQYREVAQRKSAEVRRPRKLASLVKVRDQMSKGITSARKIAKEIGMGKTYVQKLINEIRNGL